MERKIKAFLLERLDLDESSVCVGVGFGGAAPPFGVKNDLMSGIVSAGNLIVSGQFNTKLHTSPSYTSSHCCLNR
jgi:hypothetical protein